MQKSQVLFSQVLKPYNSDRKREDDLNNVIKVCES